jgi:heptosyltransferase III
MLAPPDSHRASSCGKKTVKPRVLVIFPGALGDLICLGPALGELARRYPGAELELMARGELADFAVERMGVTRAHSIDRPEVSLLFNSAPDAPRRARLWFGAFDVIHSVFGTANARCREVLAEAAGGRVYFHPFRPHGGGHVSAGYLRAIGAETQAASEYRLALRDEDLACGARTVQRLGWVQPPILLFPGSGSPLKNWPVRSFVELGLALGRDRIIVVIGPAEEDLAKELAGFAIVRRPALGCLAGLAHLSLGFVGNDSGVSHLAAAAGARGVVIFGPTEPARWRPLGAVTVCRRMPLAELSWQEIAETLRPIVEHAESGA